MGLSRLGILTDEVAADVDTALDWAAARGLGHVELRMVDGVNLIELPPERIRRIGQAAAERGIAVSCIASPVFKCALDPTRQVASGDRFGQEEEGVEAHFAKLNRAMDIALQLETRQIRLFSFWRESEPERYTQEIADYLKSAAALAESRGVMLLLENEPACNGGDAEEAAAIVRLVNSPVLRLLWDPGNEAGRGRMVYPDSYERIRDVLHHIHLKDVVIPAAGGRRFVPIGQGRSAYADLLPALCREGYAGQFTLEPHFIPAQGTAADGAGQSLESLLALAERTGTREALFE